MDHYVPAGSGKGAGYCLADTVRPASDEHGGTRHAEKSVG
jgi:hypothetical protein